MSTTTDNMPWDPDPVVLTPDQASPETDEGPTVGRRSVPVALAGKRFDPKVAPVAKMPEYPVYDPSDDYKVLEDVDYSDVSSLNRDINIARATLFRAVERLKHAKRAESDARFTYNRAYNRVLAGLTGGSEKQRLAIADIQTEELYGKLIVEERLADEAVNFLRAIRSELDSLAGLSHNVRAQMQLQ